MKFQYKVWKTGRGQGAFRVRLVDGEVLGVELTEKREMDLELLFAGWAKADVEAGRKTHWNPSNGEITAIPKPKLKPSSKL